MKNNQRISSLYVDNKIFSDYLCDRGFILRDDSIVELTDCISQSMSLSLDNDVKSIFLSTASQTAIENSFNFGSERKNFICNGVFQNVDSYISNVLSSGAFNVGVCTSDMRMFSLGKRSYQNIYGKLIAMGIPVFRTEENLGDERVYLLSYRKWK